jgi:hypothetical protein
MTGDPVAVRWGHYCAVGLFAVVIAAASGGCTSSRSPNVPSTAGPNGVATTAASSSTYLADAKVVEGPVPITGPARINGKEYEHSIVQPSYIGSSTETQYDLGRNCDQLTFTAGLPDDSTSTGTVQFEVYGDDKQLISVRVDFGAESQQTVSLVNYLRLKVRNTGIKGRGKLSAGWGSAAIRCRTS